MSEIQKNEILEKSKELSQWFSIDFSIKVFGVEILSFHFPPKK